MWVSSKYILYWPTWNEGCKTSLFPPTHVVTSLSPEASSHLSHCFSSIITALSSAPASFPQIRQSSLFEVRGNWYSRIIPCSRRSAHWNCCETAQWISPRINFARWRIVSKIVKERIFQFFCYLILNRIFEKLLRRSWK